MKNISARTVKKVVSLGIIMLLLLFFAYFNIASWLEYRVQDTVFQEAGLLHPDIAVIGIDAEALDMFGSFPWPRSVFAEAIDILNTYDDWRPAVIGIDVLFVEYSRFHPEGDYALADALYRAGNVVLASELEIGTDTEALILEPTILAHLKPNSIILPYAEHGLINAIRDRDGVIRNAFLWERHESEQLFSFPVVISMMYLDITEPVDFIRENPYMFIRYSGYPGIGGRRGDFFWYSFAQIFDPDFDPGALAGMIVLIGPYAVGMMDHHDVPILRGAPMYGVEIHANVIQQILDEAFFLYAPEWVGVLVIVLTLLIGMVLGEFLDFRIMLIYSIAVGLVYFFGVQYIFSNHYYVLPVLTPPLVLGVATIYQLIYGYSLNAVEKGRLRSTFMKYVDPKLVDKLVESRGADSDAVGSKKDIAVLFVDVRGFTPMTERLKDTPEVIVDTLNKYLELTSASVFNNGGSVDKFVGDATMALFNGFMSQDDYIYMAVKAAWDMVLGAAAVNEQIKQRYGLDIGFGVGVHCGSAIVGNLGPSFRKDYTAIGDTVNTAARIESSAKPSQVLISRDVYESLGERITAVSVGKVTLKGKSEPIELFELTGVK